MYTCGITHRSYSVSDARYRVEAIASALAHDLSWSPNQGSQRDKVTAIFSFNSIDTILVSWAIHRLSGIVSPANALYTQSELLYQLRKCRASILFTCASLLPTALGAAAQAGIPESRIFLLNVANDITPNGVSDKFRTVDDLVREGSSPMSPLEPLRWSPGQGASQLAYICFSSGTSGLPKGVMITHRNIIANVIQLGVFERMQRTPGATEAALGLLPQSHIYALVVICHACIYRGDEVVVLPKYELHAMLRAVTKLNINTLFLVPPIILHCLRSLEEVRKYDLSCATNLMTGAASFSDADSAVLRDLFPNGILRQGYGLTESATVVCSSPRFDVLPESSGILLPEVDCRIVDENGVDIVKYSHPGELWVRSPSVALGYLDDEVATSQTFEGGWLRTGDKAEIRLSAAGYEHVFIIDRIKELIKVKGMQVAPAELEAIILQHPAVVDVAVIPVEDSQDGEVPKAFIVKKDSVTISDEQLKYTINDIIRKNKSRYKWLKGGIEIRASIPKSSSGKILRRILKEEERRRSSNFAPIAAKI